MSSQLREFMQAQVEEWLNSGMSKITYAEKLGISRHKFEYWVRKLRNESATEAATQFIQLEPKDKTVKFPMDEKPLVREPQPQVVLTFSNGACLKVYI